ncbi:hypothetical protein AZE42_06000 [Rhizopogon vesiculosus]|uniref:Uncharacterized protein n=1 Tax=Rhizopogon vesiculosus TaxID=180088 RepID=A0A1J8QT71_9AGAM|nr:hypothetical protein AZE42_06000 [Rhizopogon vesiculosus]
MSEKHGHVICGTISPSINLTDVLWPPSVVSATPSKM